MGWLILFLCHSVSATFGYVDHSLEVLFSASVKLSLASPPASGEAQPLSLLPSEQEEAEIELVCTSLLLMVLLRAISLAHF